MLGLLMFSCFGDRSVCSVDEKMFEKTECDCFELLVIDVLAMIGLW